MIIKIKVKVKVKLAEPNIKIKLLIIKILITQILTIKTKCKSGITLKQMFNILKKEYLY